MKLDQLIEYNKRNIFLQTSCIKPGSETSSRPLYFLKNLYEVKTSGQYLLIALNLACNKNKLYETLDMLKTRDMLKIILCIKYYNLCMISQ